MKCFLQHFRKTEILEICRESKGELKIGISVQKLCNFNMNNMVQTAIKRRRVEWCKEFFEVSVVGFSAR